MSKVAAVIEARMSSHRLPGKVMLHAGGKPLLEFLIERLRRARSLDDIVVATSTNAADDTIVGLCEKISVPFFRGSEENVLERVCGAASFVEAETIVEITGDCPLVDPVLVDEAVAVFRESYPKTRYVSNGAPEGNAPIGMCVQVFSSGDLKAILNDNPTALEREHVSQRFYSEKYRSFYCPKSLTYSLPVGRPDVWVTLDYREDYEMIRRLIEELSKIKKNFGAADIVAWVDRNREAHERCKAVRKKAKE